MPAGPARFVGIDVGATQMHVAALEGTVADSVTTASVSTASVTTTYPATACVATAYSTSDIGEVVRACEGATAIAIDAPSEPADGRVHAGARSPKFSVARCNEIAAGEQLGVWVPWVTPVLDDCPAWMRTGFALWAALRNAGHAPMEVYPAGCFWLLNGRRWPPKKSSAAGRTARLALLAPHTGRLALSSHDLIDAVMAAVVARGPARAVGHAGPGCDDSRLYVLA